MRIRHLWIGVLAAFLAVSPGALGANQTVSVSSNQFTPKHVAVKQGEMVTWNNTGGFHNVHFDDNSYIQPPTASSEAWSVSRTFNSIGTFKYYCDAHGAPNGVGMSGTVTVDGPGYPRPKGATPLRASLAPAYRQCQPASANRTHGAPLSHPSCSPPVQTSDWLTVGSPDANMRGANSVGFVSLAVQPGDPGTTADEANVRLVSSVSDVRRKSDLEDYGGELQARLSLRVTDRHNGSSLTEPATGDTPFTFTIPCATTPDVATIGSTCSITTTADAVLPGTVLEGRRAIWELGKVEVFDGGSDGLASTAGNTLFAAQAIFVP